MRVSLNRLFQALEQFRAGTLNLVAFNAELPEGWQLCADPSPFGEGLALVYCGTLRFVVEEGPYGVPEARQLDRRWGTQRLWWHVDGQIHERVPENADALRKKLAERVAQVTQNRPTGAGETK